MQSEGSFELYGYLLTNDSITATTQVSAQEWAYNAFLPHIFPRLLIALGIHFLIFFEFFLHLPPECAIWMRLIKRRNPTRPILPWSTLWLRYCLLAEVVILLLIMYDRLSSPDACFGVLLPLLYAWTAILSLSTGFVAAWRSQMIAKAALSSRLQYNLVRVSNIFCLVARLVVLVVAFSMQSKRHHSMQSIVGNISSYTEPATCFARTNARPPPSGQYLEEGLPALRLDYAFMALLSTIFVTDILFGAVTLSCTVKLKQGVRMPSKLLDHLLANSIKFYSVLLVVDILAMITYAIVRSPNVVMLRMTAGAVIMIRVLLDEQKCIIRYSRVHSTATRTPWRECTRGPHLPPHYYHHHQHHLPREQEEGDASRQEQEAAPTYPQTIQLEAKHSRAGGTRRKCNRATRIFDRGASVAPDGCCSCRQVTSALQMRRRGAGLTDIEQVTVLEQTCSLDQARLPVDNNDRMDRAFRSLIAEWTLQTAGAMAGDTEEEEDVDKIEDVAHDSSRLRTSAQQSHMDEKGSCARHDGFESGDDVEDPLPSPSSSSDRNVVPVTRPAVRPHSLQ